MNMMTAIASPPGTPAPGIAQLFYVERELKLRRLFAHFDRGDIEAGVDLLIQMLDERDGDEDLEPNGDEQDHDFSEECFIEHGRRFDGPGCPISDPGGGNVTDEPHDEKLEPAF